MTSRMNCFTSIVFVWTVFCCAIVLEAKMMYEIVLNGFEAIPLEREDYIDYGTIRLARKGKNTFSIAGSFSMLQNAGSEVKAHWTMYKVDIVGMKHKFVHGYGTLCQIIAADESIYPALLEVSTLPPQHACPFPKGNYTIYDYVADEDSFPTAVPLSEWLLEVYLSVDAKIAGGFRVRCATKAAN